MAEINIQIWDYHMKVILSCIRFESTYSHIKIKPRTFLFICCKNYYRICASKCVSFWLYLKKNRFITRKRHILYNLAHKASDRTKNMQKTTAEMLAKISWKQCTLKVRHSENRTIWWIKISDIPVTNVNFKSTRKLF